MIDVGMGLFLGIPLLVVLSPLLIPRRWLACYGMVQVYAIGALWIDESRQCATCGGPGSGLGLALASLMAFGIAIAFAMRFAWVLYRRAPGRELFDGACANAVLGALISLAPAGLLAAVVVGMGLGADSPLAAHVLVVCVALGWLALFRWLMPEGAPWRLPAQAAGLTGAVAMMAATAWSLDVAVRATDAAAEVAAGRPYCIQIPALGAMRPVRDRFDLSGFAMQARGGSVRHASLAMGQPASPVWFNWSYRLSRFDVDRIIGGVLRCDPRPSAAAALAWFSRQEPDIAAGSFWLGGAHWRVPAEFDPLPVDVPPRIVLRAQGSEFTAPTGPRSEQHAIDQMVFMSLCTPRTIHPWYTEGDASHRVTVMGSEHGMEKRQVVSTHGGMERIQFVARDAAGKPDSWLECHGSSCQHAMIRRGMVVHFMHPATDMADWRAREDALWRRIEGFALQWPVQAPQSCPGF